MYFTGFADEACPNLDGQIAVTKELGWSAIESRNIDGVNLHNLSDEAFETAYAKLQEAGVRINCFGSEIANWGKRIDSEEDFQKDLEATQRCIARMKRLGTKLIRIMSYAVLPDREPEDQMREERFRRLNEIVPRFLDAGLQPVHENCMNYGGMGWSYTLDVLDNVPGLKLVFDTGNPVFTDDRTQKKPYPKQSPWEFWRAVRDHVVYIHIKDGRMDGDKMVYTYPDEGSGDVPRIMDDAFARGYDGGISLEPHLGVVFHDPAAGADVKAKFCHDMYVEYGHRMEKIVADAMRKAGRA